MRFVLAPHTSRHRIRTRLVGCVAVGVLGVACGPATSSAPTDAPTTTNGAGAGSTTTAGATTPTDASTTVPIAVPAALEVRAALVGGSEIDLADYAGRALALWFWAPT